MFSHQISIDHIDLKNKERTLTLIIFSFLSFYIYILPIIIRVCEKAYYFETEEPIS